MTPRVTDDFWAHFVKHYWNRKPGAFVRPLDPPVIRAQDVFENAVEASERLRRGERGPRVDLFVEHLSVGAPRHRRYIPSLVFQPHNHLPTPADRTLEQYADRMKKRFHGQRFGLQVLGCNLLFENWSQFQRVARGIYQQLGVFAGGVDTVSFIGNYRYTPFGIHLDTQHVLTFVAAGHKRFLTWPEKLFRKRPEAIRNEGKLYIRDSADFLATTRSGTMIEGRAGDVLYWPSSFWHRAEPSLELTATMTFGIHSRRLAMAPRYDPDHAPYPQFTPDELEGVELHLPSRLRDWVRDERRRQKARLEAPHALRGWLAFVSAGGFWPGPLPVDDAAGERRARAVKLRASEHPIRWAAAGGGGLLVAVNGNTVRLRSAAAAPALLRRLNAGAAVPANSLRQLRGVKGEPHLLKFLLSVRGVTACEPDSRKRR